MGSFSLGGQRYSLMTTDAIKAKNFDENRPQTDDLSSMTSNMSIVYIGNIAHVVEPARYDDPLVPDEDGKPSLLIHNCHENTGL